MAFNLGTIWAEIGLNTKKLDDGLMKAQTKLATADKEINTMGQKLTLASTKMMVAGGIMAGAVAAAGLRPPVGVARGALGAAWRSADCPGGNRRATARQPRAY